MRLQRRYGFAEGAWSRRRLPSILHCERPSRLGGPWHARPCGDVQALGHVQLDCALDLKNLRAVYREGRCSLCAPSRIPLLSAFARHPFLHRWRGRSHGDSPLHNLHDNYCHYLFAVACVLGWVVEFRWDGQLLEAFLSGIEAGPQTSVVRER